jgi:hypothetical protein
MLYAKPSEQLVPYCLWKKLSAQYEVFSVVIKIALVQRMFLYVMFLVRQPPLGHGFLIHEVTRSHTRRTTVGRTPLNE